MAGKVEIIGIGELNKHFSDLKRDLIHKTSLRMVASAGNVLKKEAKAIAQAKGLKISGSLIRNIAIKRERKAPPGVTQYNLGVRHGRDLGKRHTKYLAFSKVKGRIVIRRKDDPFYWKFIEFGHKIVPRASGQLGNTDVFHTRLSKYWKVRTIKRTLSNDSITIRRRSPSGFVEAVPFIQPALQNKAQEAIKAMEERLIKEIEKYK